MLAGGLEVQNPIHEVAIINSTSLSEQYTSLLASSLDDTLFLFAGTNTGKIHQVLSVYIIKHTFVLLSTHAYQGIILLSTHAYQCNVMLTAHVHRSVLDPEVIGISTSNV